MGVIRFNSLFVSSTNKILRESVNLLMDVETCLIQLPPYTRWGLFALIVSLSVSLNESTEILTQFGTVGKIELNFDTSGHVPIVTWTLPQSTIFQHNLQVDNVVKTTEDYKSTVAEDGVFAALEIYKVNFLDAGTYTCRMDFSDTGRSSVRSIQVSVIAFPSVSMANGAKENETISATCCIYVSLAVEDIILWTLNQSGPLLSLHEVKTHSPAGAMKNMCSEITFEVRRSYHRQLLRCSLLKKRSVYSEVAMKVQYPASVRMMSLSTTVPEGSDIIIECQSDGYPPPDTMLVLLSNMNGTEWAHFPIKAKMSNKSITTWKFELNSLAMNDSGKYQCVANNSEGYASMTSIGNLSTVYLPRQFLAAVISVVLALIFLVALLIRILKNRHDRSCEFSSNRKRFQKEDGNSDNDKKERQQSVYYHNYPADFRKKRVTEIMTRTRENIVFTMTITLQIFSFMQPLILYMKFPAVRRMGKWDMSLASSSIVSQITRLEKNMMSKSGLATMETNFAPLNLYFTNTVPYYTVLSYHASNH
ncbi:uncharacterized protein [Apostichopus japonicus]|uniref:uncharacterized protein isoform X3 n=1 Tax=Stichopus japonicus TaxID=307972 RepID=UPI003AB83F6C